MQKSFGRDFLGEISLTLRNLTKNQTENLNKIQRGNEEARGSAQRAIEELDYLGNLGRCAILGNLGTAKDFRREETGYKIRSRTLAAQNATRGKSENKNNKNSKKHKKMQ